MINKVFFYTVCSFILLAIPACNQQKKTGNNYIEEIDMDAISKITNITYGGLNFQNIENWHIDTLSIDEDTKRISFTPEDDDNSGFEITVNIHNTILNKDMYINQLKKSILHSEKTRKAVFSIPATKILPDWKNSIEYSFATVSNPTIDGYIIVMPDADRGKTYSIICKGPSYYINNTNTQALVNSIEKASLLSK